MGTFVKLEKMICDDFATCIPLLMALVEHTMKQYQQQLHHFTVTRIANNATWQMHHVYQTIDHSQRIHFSDKPLQLLSWENTMKTKETGGVGSRGSIIDASCKWLLVYCTPPKPHSVPIRTKKWLPVYRLNRTAYHRSVAVQPWFFPPVFFVASKSSAFFFFF